MENLNFKISEAVNEPIKDYLDGSSEKESLLNKLEEMKNDNKLASQAIRQLEPFMKNLNLPTTISELGINVFEKDNLKIIAEFTCRKGSEIHFLPFPVVPNDIVKVISEFERQKITTSNGY